MATESLEWVGMERISLPVFEYEQVLVVPSNHSLASFEYIEAEDLRSQVLITYPVAPDRLDIYTQFLNPGGVVPQRHKVSETTDIMLQMVASGRGVTALPRWLAEEYSDKLPLAVVRLGKSGISKKIYLGTRNSDSDVEYLRAFVTLASGCDYPSRATLEP